MPSVKTSDTSETRSKDSLGPTLNGMEAAALIGSFSHRQDAASRPVPALKEAFDEVVLLVLKDLPKSVWWPPSIAAALIGSFSHRNDSLILCMSSTVRCSS